MLALFDQGLMKSQSLCPSCPSWIFGPGCLVQAKNSQEIISPFLVLRVSGLFLALSSLPRSEESLGGPSWYRSLECGSGSVLVLALSRWGYWFQSAGTGAFLCSKVSLARLQYLGVGRTLWKE